MDPNVEPAPAKTRATGRRKARFDVNPGGVVTILGGGAAVAGTFLEMAKIELDNPDGPLGAVGGPVITAGPGLYVCIAGGVVAAIGALFAASRR